MKQHYNDEHQQFMRKHIHPRMQWIGLDIASTEQHTVCFVSIFRFFFFIQKSFLITLAFVYATPFWTTTTNAIVRINFPIFI